LVTSFLAVFAFVFVVFGLAFAFRFLPFSSASVAEDVDRVFRCLCREVVVDGSADDDFGGCCSGGFAANFAEMLRILALRRSVVKATVLISKAVVIIHDPIALFLPPKELPQTNALNAKSKEKSKDRIGTMETVLRRWFKRM